MAVERGERDDGGGHAERGGGDVHGGYSLAEPSLLTSGEGRSVDLNGSTGYVPLASSSYNFAGRTAFTLVATVKLDTLANSGRLLTRLVSDGGRAAGDTTGWCLARDRSSAGAG